VASPGEKKSGLTRRAKRVPRTISPLFWDRRGRGAQHVVRVATFFEWRAGSSGSESNMGAPGRYPMGCMVTRDHGVSGGFALYGSGMLSCVIG